jgi:hypothetical protein
MLLKYYIHNTSFPRLLSLPSVPLDLIVVGFCVRQNEASTVSGYLPDGTLVGIREL